MSTTSGLHGALAALAEQGLLRRLSPAFASFIDSLEAGRACAPTLLCAALVSELEGRGHSCLHLNDLLPDPCRLLSWDEAAWRELAHAAGLLPDSIGAWRDALAACPQVRCAPGPDAQQPLVLDGERLYLRRYWCDETLVAQAVAARAALARPLDPVATRDWLERLFGSVQGEEPDWQKLACAIALRSGLSIITGGPGTGKTYTAARLLALLFALAGDARQLRIALAAPTGKAATRLKQSIDAALVDLEGKVGDLPLAELTARMAPAATLHSLLGARPDTRRPRHHRGNPLDIDVLIVDEASMVHLEMMAALLDALPEDAMLILLGDKDQLASVEAGAVLGDLCHRAQEGRYHAQTLDYLRQVAGAGLPQQYLGDGGAIAQQTVMLRRSRRFGGPIGRLALAVNDGDVQQAQAVLRAGEDGLLAWIEHARQADLLALALHGRPGASVGYSDYLGLLREAPGDDATAAHENWVRAVLVAFDRFRILCALREGDWGVAGINAAIEKRLNETGLLACRGEWYAGRPVMVTRNDHGLGVFNGDVGIALPDPARSGSLRVYFLAGDSLRSVLATRLPHVDTAFAMTVHKVQGSEFLHAAMVLPPVAPQVIARELVYTGITRAREYFTLLSPEPSVVGQGIGRRTTRSSGLRDRVGLGD